MELAVTLELTLALAGTIILALLIALRYLVVNLYMHVRQERDLLLRNRDDWRGVAERALLMATLNQSLAKRATALATKTVRKTPP